MRRISLITFLAMLFAILLSSCNSSDESLGATGGKPYDPTQAVKLQAYYPQNGGIATKVIIRGENFGIDPSLIKVYYNNKRAAIVRAMGDKIYVITPRQPGDECIVSVVVGNDSTAFQEKFEYKTQVAVTTLTGAPKNNDNAVDGTLAEAQFSQTYFLCVDKERNIFMIENRKYKRLRQINEAKNLVTTYSTGNAPFAPTVELEGQKIYVPLWITWGNIQQFDPQTQWARKDVKPQNVELDEYISVASNPLDKMIYIKAKNGNLAKMDPKTKEATLIAKGLDPGLTYQAYICFDSLDPNLLYICYSDKNCIYRYNLATGVYELYAGMKASPGFLDGKRLDAQFNAPCQICFDLDGIMYIADSKNHCIRSINREGIVGTVIGIPGKSGYVDGIPDDALFDTPNGVAVDDEGTIYIADTNNRCVRKLAIQ